MYLIRLFETKQSSYESRGERKLKIRGENDIRVLRLGASLLLEQELQSIAWLQSRDWDMSESKNAYGPDFMPALRAIAGQPAPVPEIPLAA